LVFKLGRCPQIDIVVTAALCRPIETSSEVDETSERDILGRAGKQRNQAEILQ
jgi:hypothetical protein